MKKITATVGVASVVTLSTLGFVAPAHADSNDYRPTPPSGGGESPSGIDSGVAGNAANDNSDGLLPSTGGPETALLIGGAALLAVGGVALVATRRRSNHG